MDFLTWGHSLIQTFGYLGLAIVNLVGSATIFFPLPIAAIVFISGGFLNPWLVALFAAIGCTFGELTGYGLGKGGGKVLEKYKKGWRVGRSLRLGEKWFKRGRGFFCIFFFAATPLPYDVVGVLGGMFNYNIKKFILASFLGKWIMNLALAFGGFYGINWILNIFKFSL